MRVRVRSAIPSHITFSAPSSNFSTDLNTTVQCHGPMNLDTRYIYACTHTHTQFRVRIRTRPWFLFAGPWLDFWLLNRCRYQKVDRFRVGGFFATTRAFNGGNTLIGRYRLRAFFHEDYTHPTEHLTRRIVHFEKIEIKRDWSFLGLFYNFLYDRNVH